MTPGAYRAGGAKTAIAFAIASSPLGHLLVAATPRGVCAIRFGESAQELERELRQEFHAAELSRNDSGLRGYVDMIVAAIRGDKTSLDLPLEIRATAFQRRVWDVLRQIPRGETRSYADIAREIGAPAAVRAVARACASNPVAVAVPCHRVIRSDGGLAGYRWGMKRKQKLLASEKSSPGDGTGGAPL